MAIDGKLLAKARGALEDKRREREARLDRRLGEVYAKSPRIKELDMQIKKAMAGLIDIAFGEAADTQIEDIRSEIERLESQRRSELVKNGFQEGYLDDDYICATCNDKGYVNGNICSCLKKLYQAEQKASLSSLLKLGDETFDSFDLTYYDDTPRHDTGVSPRETMTKVFNICSLYAQRFGSGSANLLFTGAPGLGKTFLSACIARVVAEKEHSVVYDTAGSVFSKFEDEKFSKADSVEETRSDIKRYLGCDLLIIDDLGTELTTNFTVSALYEIINTRLITSKKTIINTNLTIDEMRNRYSEQIMSRLEGEYQILMFYGDDIRMKKKGVK